jgi:hypothetical protein
VTSTIIFLAVLPLCYLKILPLGAPFLVMWVWPIVSYIRRQKPVEDQIEIGWKSIDMICQEESRKKRKNAKVSFYLRDGGIDEMIGCGDNGKGDGYLYDDNKYIEVVVLEGLKKKN